MKVLRLFLLGLFVVGAIAYLNAILPTPQKAQAQFSINHEQSYTCNSNLTVLLDPAGESACQNSWTDTSATSYKSGVTIKEAPGSHGTYTVHWMWAQFWCQNPSAHPCLDNGTAAGGGEQTATLTENSPVTATSDTKTPTASFAGQACGVYQNDFGFYVTSDSNPSQHLCSGAVLDVNSLGRTANNNASSCNTTNQCNTLTPTVTPPAQHHLACENNACVQKDGPAQAGETTCTAVADNSSECSHLTCQHNACARVAGAGDNQCSHDSDCTVVTPTLTPTPTTTIITCFNKDNQLIQVGINDIALCQNQNQNQSQNQYNNQTVNVNVQQQQQQAVLGASVAPAPTTTQLPSTGAEGFATIATLLSLIPAGFKIRKLV